MLITIVVIILKGCVLAIVWDFDFESSVEHFPVNLLAYLLDSWSPVRQDATFSRLTVLGSEQNTCARLSKSGVETAR